MSVARGGRETPSTVAQIGEMIKGPIGGGIAGALAKTAIAPLERLRLLKQTGSTGRQSIVSATFVICQNESLLGFWRGNWMNCVRVFPSRAVLFTTNDFMQKQWRRVRGLEAADDPPRPSPRTNQIATITTRKISGNNSNSPLPVAALATSSTISTSPVPSLNVDFIALFLAGGVSGMAAIFASHPMDVARTRIAGRLFAKDTLSRQWARESSSMTYVLYRMAREEGFRSWYRGVGPTLLGAIPYEGIKFSVFGMLTRSNTKSDGMNLIAGAVAGLAAGLCLFPNDTIRKLMQLKRPEDGLPRPYSSALDCWARTLRHGGPMRFYRGITPYILRIAPSSAIQFAAYEFFKVKISFS